ncbi:hypothetical protein LDL08_39090 [Nonomuraea glycinis]|uniref:Uncharacterized protein n=1 Tax=Nonomuraea glycinis TaxID=2047744 RepID=A0A918AAT0_9ACTN|nr:hypothetical protein [Nonomuraea glycinis]MCA2182182.1 hypothetical protein [Nonomuraea glycinis]GGP11425.1 hypothetical protein GCM10012278_54970 [Nonomuraea glycinis]
MFGEDRYELYGLPSGNPYAGRPLDPLLSPSDCELILELEGFIRLAMIQAVVEQAIKEKRPAFFLIVGVGNSGRTTLANHVMHLYRQAAAAHAPEFTFLAHGAERGDMTHDSYAVLCSTLLSLRNKMKGHQIPISRELGDWFAELSQKGRMVPLNEYDLQEIAESTARECASREAGFGIRYEGVPDKRLIPLAQRVFENTSTVVVFTVDDYQHANTVQLTEADRQAFGKQGHVCDLNALTPRQIAALATDRWNGTSPTPFDSEGIQKVFGARSYTIGQALRHLEILLDLRLSEYERDEPWPTDDLRIHELWIRLKLWQRDKWNKLDGIDG